MGNQPVGRPLSTEESAKQNKRTQTFMSLAGFEPMIPVFQRAKTFYALGRAATMIGCVKYAPH
jgi:hypothetical protein